MLLYNAKEGEQVASRVGLENMKTNIQFRGRNAWLYFKTTLGEVGGGGEGSFKQL